MTFSLVRSMTTTNWIRVFRKGLEQEPAAFWSLMSVFPITFLWFGLNGVLNDAQVKRARPGHQSLSIVGRYT